MELGGTLQPTTNPAPAQVLADAVATLKKNLAQGPFRVQVLREGERSGGAVAGIVLPAGAAPGGRFFVEGVMRENSNTQAPSSKETPSTKTQ